MTEDATEGLGPVLFTSRLPGVIVPAPEPNCEAQDVITAIQDFMVRQHVKLTNESTSKYEQESEAALRRLFWLSGGCETIAELLYRRHSRTMKYFHCYKEQEDSFISPRLSKLRFSSFQNLNSETILGDCPICCEPFKASENAGLGCNHLACMKCVKQYIKMKVDEGQTSMYQLTCIENKCSCFYNTYHVFAVCKFDANHPTFLKYVENQVHSEFEKSPYLRYCSNVRCNKMIIADPHERRIICKACNTETCNRCRKSYHKFALCKKRGDEMKDATWKMRLYYLRNGTRPCPNCRFLIEKTKGCDHMTCSKCNYEFCWRCGKTYTQDHFANPLNCAGGSPLATEVWGPLAPVKKGLEIGRDVLLLTVVGGFALIFAWPYGVVKGRQNITAFAQNRLEGARIVVRRWKNKTSRRNYEGGHTFFTLNSSFI